MPVEEEKNQVIVSVDGIGIHPFASCQRRKLSRHAKSGSLMADHAVLAVKTFPDNLGIRWGLSGSSASRPIHGIAFIDILAESAAIEGEIESCPEQDQNKGSHEPG